MAVNSENVYEFKISLKYSKPPIWRQIQVPENYTFDKLHVAIQCAMGWRNYHLHDFEMKHPSTAQRIIIRKPDPQNDNSVDFDEFIDECTVTIKEFFVAPKTKAKYTYDFGDNWEHQVLLEKILPADPNVRYPICLKGKMACPPEDCGSNEGYDDLCAILANPGHKEHKEKKEWMENMGLGDFDPKVFDPSKVTFHSSLFQ